MNMMKNPKTSIIWKKSDRRTKRREIWDMRVVVQLTCIWGTFDLVAFNFVLGSFPTLGIFRSWGLMIRDRRNHSEWL